MSDDELAVAGRPPADGRQVSGMGLMVDVSIPRAEDFETVARDWFAEVPGAVAPAQWQEVVREDKPSFRGMPQPVWPDYEDYQEPFRVWADIVIAPAKWHGMKVWHRRVTARNLAWLEQELAARPVSARMRMCRVDANGMELPGGLSVRAEAALDAYGAEIPVARLTFGDVLTWRGEGPGAGAAVAAAVAGLAGRWAARQGVTAVFAGDDVLGATALEYSLTHRWWEIARSGDLGGYAWIMLCPASIAARLGGAAALRAAGVFYRVAELADGAALVQVTEQAGQYGMSQASAAFEVLAPVLHRGMPQKRASWPEGLPWRVVPQDAATWRARSGRAAGDGR